MNIQDPSSAIPAVAGGVVAFQTGMLFGAPLDCLAIGFASALFVTMWIESFDRPIKSAASVLFSCLLAGYMSPIMAIYLSHKFPELVIAPDLAYLTRGSAAIIGSITPFGFPVLLSILKRKGDAI